MSLTALDIQVYAQSGGHLRGAPVALFENSKH